LKLALEGGSDIGAGRTVSRAAYKRRLAELIKARTPK
jgi:hypothetical protein